MSQYKIVHAEDATRYLKARLLDDDGVKLEDIRRVAGVGEPIDEAPLNELRVRLLKIKKRYPVRLRLKDPEGGRFESEACASVHLCMQGLDRFILADYDFWTWLAVDFLADLLEWRFGTDGRPAQPANYGIGARAENLWFRLWLRGELGKAPGTDPYELAKSGDQDLWRSHLLRQGYANARALAHAVLKLQAGSLKVDKKTVKRLAGGDDPNGVRMLAKRIRRMRANLVLEYLTPQQAESLVSELSADLKKAK